MSRALSGAEVLKVKRCPLAFEGEWADAFGQPDAMGTWIIWGSSGNGKTSFVMQLCKELSRHGKVAYNSLEEGYSMSMQNAIRRHGLDETENPILFLEGESMKDLSKRLKKQRSPWAVIIDSFQYSQMKYNEYIEFKEKHKDKLIIFVSHADGASPAGRTAVKVKYDASLKILVQGFKAISMGRFIGEVGSYTIWQKGAERYWGEKQEQSEEQ